MSVLTAEQQARAAAKLATSRAGQGLPAHVEDLAAASTAAAAMRAGARSGTTNEQAGAA